MAYVILSRITSIDQLYLKPFDPRSIYCSEKAKKEALRLKGIAINKITTNWDIDEQDVVKISSLNVRSLSKHGRDIERDVYLNKSDILCLIETWLTSDLEDMFANYQHQYFINARSRGIVLLSKINPIVVTKLSTDFCSIIGASYDKFDIIAVYRFSDGGNYSECVEALIDLINMSKTTVIVGDINIDILSEPQNQFTAALTSLGFIQKVTSPTHLLGGLIDHIYVRDGDHNSGIVCDVTLHPLYFSDHDATSFRLKLLSDGMDFNN